MAKKQRSWTLKARTTRFAMNFVFDIDDVVEVDLDHMLMEANAHKSETMESIACKSLDNAETTLHLTNLWLGEEDEYEVISWLRDETKGKFELMHERGTEGALFHFRFFDLDDALKFKLCFGEALVSGAA